LDAPLDQDGTALAEILLYELRGLLPRQAPQEVRLLILPVLFRTVDRDIEDAQPRAAVCGIGLRVPCQAPAENDSVKVEICRCF
jgi:hypothetical protein